MKKTLSVNKEVYSLQSLEESISDYRDLAKIKIDEQNQYWIVHFLKTKYDTEMTICEFENHLIDIENNK